LLLFPARVMDVVDRGDHRRRRIQMTTSTTESEKTAQATNCYREARTAQEGQRSHRSPVWRPRRVSRARRTTSAKKAAKAPKKATSAKADGVREGSKTEKVLELLKRSGGATLAEIMKATDWQPHSVRGFISGTLDKKMGLQVESAKNEDGERFYSIT
jgi:hypothetical protein